MSLHAGDCIVRWVGVLLCSATATACTFQMPPDRVEDLLAQGLRAAETHHEFDMDPEAAVLLDAISGVDATYPGVRELDEDLDPAARIGVERTLLGMNRRIRPQLERTGGQRAMLWLPDRLLDLMDVVTFGVHFGPGAFADSHLTRAVQVGGGFRATGGVGMHDYRSLGLKSQSEAGLSVVAIGTHTYVGGLVGTSGTWSTISNVIGLHNPKTPLYQEMRDYWSIGASATGGIVGAEVDFHPLQLADFFAGLVGVDFLNDDFAHTRGLKLDAIEQQLLVEMGKVRRSKPVLEAYLAMRRSQATGPLAPTGPERRPAPAQQAGPSAVSPAPAKAAPEP